MVEYLVGSASEYPGHDVDGVRARQVFVDNLRRDVHFVGQFRDCHFPFIQKSLDILPTLFLFSS